MRWQVKQRVDFIRHSLERNGRVNRSDLVNEYGISTQQAAADFKLFQHLHPGRMEYDKRKKTYTATNKEVTVNRVETIKRIQELLANEAGEHLAYTSWSDDFCRSQLRELRDKIIEKLGRVSLAGLTAKEADELGFGRWTEGSTLRLAPIWLYPFLNPGDELESISGGKTIVAEDYSASKQPDGEPNEGYIDNDQRFGYLAYGVRVAA